MEQDVRKTRTCEKCKTAVPLNEVRLYPYSQDRNMLVCGKCCEELKNRANSPESSGPVRNIPKPKVKPEIKPPELKYAPIINKPVTLQKQPEPANKPRWAAAAPVVNKPITSSVPAASKVIDVKDRPYPEIKTVPYTPNPAKNVSKRSINPLPEPEYANYKCLRCNYNFKADLAKVGVTYNLCCPSCGRAEKLHKLEPWA